MTLSHPFTNPKEQLKPINATLPTMYDLPSEDPEEPGLPDEFHDFQPELLSATLRLTDVKGDRIFTGTDLNLYYDVQNPLWHKRPDWFAVIGVPRFYDERELRLSYVVWDEGVNPSIVVELLSPGTDKEDLGLTKSKPGKPPTKWVVYEQILKIPYYILYDRYSDELRFYQLVKGRYQAQPIQDERIWIPQYKIGLGLWEGEHQGCSRKWLRWLDSDRKWIPTPLEQSEIQQAQAELQREQAELQREQAEAKAARLAQRLRELGIDPDEV
jgi:Uma2 family endonuclease